MWLVLAGLSGLALWPRLASLTNSASSTPLPAVDPSSPPASSPEPPPPEPPGAALKDLVPRLAREAEAARVARSIGVYLAPAVPGSSPLAEHRAGGSFAAASVVKVPIMMALLSRWNEGSLKRTASQERLLRRMIQDSDNPATARLIGIVGRRRVNAEIARLLAEKRPITALDRSRRSLVSRRRRNQACPREVAHLLSLISEWERAGRKEGAQMLAIMRGTAAHHRTRIPQGVPPEHRHLVANKTGTLADVVIDSAILETPSGERYVFCLFLEGIRSHSQAESFCRKLTQQCWKALTETSG
jgi:beta-lactamase class A